jgi:hypothetical protein
MAESIVQGKGVMAESIVQGKGVMAESIVQGKKPHRRMTWQNPSCRAKDHTVE